jgi:hypothetical protein
MNATLKAPGADVRPARPPTLVTHPCEPAEPLRHRRAAVRPAARPNTYESGAPTPKVAQRLQALIRKIEVKTMFDQAARLACGPSSVTDRWNEEELEYQCSRGEDADGEENARSIPFAATESRGPR